MPEFVKGIEEFFNKAIILDEFIRDGYIKYHCVKCKCIKVRSLEEVELHLYKKEFMPNYFMWIRHVEFDDSASDVNFQNAYGNGTGLFVEMSLIIIE